MDNIKDFYVGQIVYIKLNCNAAKDKTGSELVEEWEITKIGTKYLTAKSKKNHIEHMFESISHGYDGHFVEKSDYTPNFILYKNKQELLDEIEIDELYTKIRNVFSYYRNVFTLEQLRKINLIIEKKK